MKNDDTDIVELSESTKNIIHSIHRLDKKEFNGFKKLNESLQRFPFFICIDRAFKELGIDADTSRTYISGADSDFEIHFSYNNSQWCIFGSVKFGVALVTKYKDGGR